MADSVRQALADRLLELDGQIESNQQRVYASTSAADTYQFVEKMKNTNTQAKTKYDMKKVAQWLWEMGEERQPEDIPPKKQDMFLARMMLSLKKVNGEEFEPDSLRSLFGSISRHLTSKNYSVNITTDLHFKHSRNVLASKRKKQSLGNKKSRADAFTDNEMSILKEKSLLGANNPEALINTIWMNNTVRFGLRGRQEHTDMLWGGPISRCRSNITLRPSSAVS